MGNHASCFLRSTRPPTANLVDADGNLRRIEIPVRAAELMLEAPGHVIARADELVKTRRVSGVRAEEQLRPRELYLLLPVDRVGSRVSDRQMAVVLGAIAEAKGRKRSVRGAGSRVFPAVNGKESTGLGVEEGRVTVFPGQQGSVYRQWKPVLDTIHESN